MSESAEKIKKSSTEFMEKKWEKGMEFQFCGGRATARGLDGKDRQIPGGMPGRIFRIGGSIRDLEAMFKFPDGFEAKLWLNFDEIEPVKEERKEEIERDSSHSKAA